jgi:hypothetical protein
MKIGEVGNSFTNTIKINYKSDRTFIDFDLIILDYSYILASQSQGDGKFFIERKNALAEFMEHKKIPLVIFAPFPLNIVFTNNGTSFTMADLLPVKHFSIVKESGERINVIPRTKFATFFEKYISYFHYSSYFSTLEGDRLLETPFTQKTISFINETCLILPPFKKPIKEIENQFLNDLFVTINNNKKNTLEIEMPEWTTNYCLPGEKETINEINNITIQLEELTSKLREKEGYLSKLNTKKILFTGSGKALENEIKSLLEEIGFEVLEAEDSREDLIVKFGDEFAVVEIKGVNGSSAEKHSAQLEKWVATYYERTDKRPKGILIINGYKETEIKNRPAEVFPHQMLKYATQREHCLITTTQLIGLYYRIKSNESVRKDLIETLFKTNGVYPNFNNWNEFLSLKDGVDNQ